MNYREQFIVWLFKNSQNIYVKYFKKHHIAWAITKKELLLYPKNTFGYHLGLFLKTNNFNLIPKIERHDCYHVLTGYSTKVKDEIALQYLCYSNGKRSFYLYGVVILGTIILPDYINYYFQSYRLGKLAKQFHHLNFLEVLNEDIGEMRARTFVNLYYI